MPLADLHILLLLFQWRIGLTISNYNTTTQLWCDVMCACAWSEYLTELMEKSSSSLTWSLIVVVVVLWIQVQVSSETAITILRMYKCSYMYLNTMWRIQFHFNCKACTYLLPRKEQKKRIHYIWRDNYYFELPLSNARGSTWDSPQELYSALRLDRRVHRGCETVSCKVTGTRILTLIRGINVNPRLDLKEDRERDTQIDFA